MSKTCPALANPARPLFPACAHNINNNNNNKDLIAAYQYNYSLLFTKCSDQQQKW